MARDIDKDGRLQSPLLARRPNGEPILIPVPTLDEMKDLTDGALFDIVRQFGMISAWPELVAESQSFANQLARLPQSASNYDEMVERLVDGFAEEGNKRVLLGMARDSVRGFVNESLHEQASPNTEFIRISEGDEHVCENCEELAGSIGTYAQHVAEGLPGQSSCLGGSYCRCVLVEID